MAEDETRTSSLPKWNTFIRQNSQKVGKFAENVVLPKNQRSREHQAPGTSTHEITVEDAESQGPYARTMTVRYTPGPYKARYIPGFMIFISLIEIGLMYIYKEDGQVLLKYLGYDPYRRHEVWRLFTVMLVHKRLSHLWNNVVFQLILGILLEIVHGWKRISIIYFLSVVGGSLFATLLDPESYAVGCSGAVYGLLLAHMSTIIINWNEMDRKCCRVFCLSAFICFIFYVEFFVIDDPMVSHAAHLGGSITGFLVSIAVLKNFEKHPWEKIVRKICIGAVIATFIGIIIFNVVAWSHFPPTEWNFNYNESFERYVMKMTAESRTLDSSDSIVPLEQYDSNNGTINNF